MLEEYLNDEAFNEATLKAKKAFRDRRGFVRRIECLWRGEGLADKFTLRHLALIECYIQLGGEAVGRLENEGAFSYLEPYSLSLLMKRHNEAIGGRPMSCKMTDLFLKLVLGASYQWLLHREIEREMDLRSPQKRNLARTVAYMSLGRAYDMKRRLLLALGPEIDELHTVMVRALWEDKYEPIVITQKGLLLDITY